MKSLTRRVCLGASLIWLLAGLWPPLAAAAPIRANCRSTISGITYCSEDSGRTHVLAIDLTNPYLRIQTVMARDVLDVRPLDEQRERIVDMARRYRNAGAVIVLNGDYFGDERGPEGPTVVEGQRLDTPTTILSNPSHYRRTTLALAPFGLASIVQLNPLIEFPQAIHDLVLYNAVSGGPIILRKGEIMSEVFACRWDRIPAATCRTERQTVAGVDAAGHTLWLAVSTVRSTAAMARLLRDYGAFNAMKLDAGGSSQLWYNGRTLLDSKRGVANALMVFVEDRPRHAVDLAARSAIPVLAVKSRSALTLTLRNSGFMTWQASRGYGLREISGASLISRRSHLVPSEVAPGEWVTLTLGVNTTNWPGVYESTWRMTGQGEDFGADLRVRVVVVPNNADDLRRAIEVEVRAVERLSPRDFERRWPATVQRIRQMIADWQAEHQECVGRRPC